MFPIECFIVEDIKAKTWQGSKKWNVSFSPLEVGKQWFYKEMWQIGTLVLKEGWETKLAFGPWEDDGYVLPCEIEAFYPTERAQKASMDLFMKEMFDELRGLGSSNLTLEYSISCMAGAVAC